MANERFYSKIVKGLEKEPAYLLVFALCCLFGLSGVTGSIYGTTQEQTLAQVLGFLSLLVSLAAAVIVIRHLAPTENSKGGPSPPQPDESLPISTSQVSFD